MKNCIWIVAMLAISFGTKAQNISGKITDANGNVVVAASVRILNTTLGAATNNKGEYLIKNAPTGQQTLLLSGVGLASQSKNVTLNNGDNTVNLVAQNTDYQLEEVVVTAEKSENTVMKTPASISVLNQQQIQANRIWNLQEVSNLLPNVSLANPGEDRNVTSIRGVVNASYDQTVAVVIDGVVQFDNDTYIGQLPDAERIEVLRGPQTTLYGRNTLGGVINIVTRQPSNKSQTNLEMSVGSFNHYRWGLSQRGALVKDKFWYGVSLLTERRDGFYTNKFNNKPFDNLRNLYGNLFLKYQFSPRLSATLNAKIANRENDGSYPLVANDSLAKAEPFKVNLNRLATDKDRTINTSLKIDYAADKFTISSITALQRNTRFYTDTLDADFGPRSFANVIVQDRDGFNTVRVFTQEIKVSSVPNASNFRWLGGVYFFSQNAPEQQGLVSVLAAPVTLANGSKVFAPYITDTRTQSDRTGFSSYFQGSLKLNKFDITAGLRYDTENRDLNRTVDLLKNGTIRDTQRSFQTYSQGGVISPKVSVSYQPKEVDYYYVSYSRGFRAGGLNEAIVDPKFSSYNAEYSDNIEIGSKHTFLNNRFKSNFTWFFTNWKDIQTPTYIPGFQTVIQNAGSLFSQGFEWEMSGVVAKGLQVDVAWAWTDATFKNLEVANPFAPKNENFKDKKQIFTPESMINLAAQYNRPLGKKYPMELMLRANWQHIGETFFNLANTVRQQPYTMLNAQVALLTKNFDVILWGKNLGDTVYLGYGYTFPGINPVSLGNPRSVGLTLRGKL
jgi:iron complex outermembrane recepter protein